MAIFISVAVLAKDGLVSVLVAAVEPMMLLLLVVPTKVLAPRIIAIGATNA